MTEVIIFIKFGNNGNLPEGTHLLCPRGQLRHIYITASDTSLDTYQPPADPPPPGVYVADHFMAELLTLPIAFILL